MDNTHTTWKPGYFVDQPKYKTWSKEEKERANADESLLVRPTPTGNAICQCVTPELAKWVAKRLNRAAILEKKIGWLIKSNAPTITIEGRKVTTEKNYLDPVTYVPAHANNNASHPDCELGVIIRVSGWHVHVLYCKSRTVQITGAENLVWG